MQQYAPAIFSGSRCSLESLSRMTCRFAGRASRVTNHYSVNRLVDHARLASVYETQVVQLQHRLSQIEDTQLQSYQDQVQALASYQALTPHACLAVGDDLHCQAFLKCHSVQAVLLSKGRQHPLLKHCSVCKLAGTLAVPPGACCSTMPLNARQELLTSMAESLGTIRFDGLQPGALLLVRLHYQCRQRS